MLYPISTKSRQLMDLSGIWEFKLNHDQETDEKWYEKKMKDSIPMPVPAAYNDLYEGAAHKNHVGYVFYQKEFSVPEAMLQQRVVLRFGSATHYARVYLNGVEIGQHKGGFLPFEFEINPWIHVGKNLLSVAVDNRVDLSTLPVGILNEKEIAPGVKKTVNIPNFDFFNYSGIMRPVKLYTTPKVYIKDIILVPSVNYEDGVVEYRIQCVGEGTVHVTVLDEDGEIVCSADGTQGTLRIPHVRLWQPLNAYLYTLHIDFGEDEYEQPFGVRTVELKNGKFLINDKPFYFKGFGKHEDFSVSGRGFNEAVNVKDINLLKWIGANSFRTSHYPYSEEMMRLADREGIVVIDEVPAVGININFMAFTGFCEGGEIRNTYEHIQTHSHHREVIRDMIDRDKNHACVVMWSIANEPASNEDGAYQYFEPLTALAKKYDPQHRPVTMVSMLLGDPKEDTIFRLADVLCLNRYYGWYESGGDLEVAHHLLDLELERWTSLYPDKPIIFTEYGADTIPGLHDTTPTMFSEEYQVEYLKINHERFDAYENVIGEQIWNFADFETYQGLMRVQGNKKGIFTRDRKPKSAAHYMRERWHQIPNFNYKP